MKKFSLALLFFVFAFLNAQFGVKVESSNSSGIKDAILYTLEGSKYIVSSTASNTNGSWDFKVKNPYTGMMKVYFPEVNETINFISENRTISMKIETESKKIKNVVYTDDANVLMEKMQDIQQKNEQIFPALVQLKEYYKQNSEFGNALNKEIDRLGVPIVIDQAKYPFISFYQKNYNKFLVQSSTSQPPSQAEISNFVINSNDYLETSSLLRPVLVSYLNAGTKDKLEASIDSLIDKLGVETPRGQTVLSEFIEIFDVYAMPELKTKLLTDAKNLKCTIHGRLASTLQANKNTEIGAVFPDYKFSSNAKNAQVKNLHNLKSSKKIIAFWSSTCSHCEKELPQFIEKYSSLKAQNVEVIGFSLDDNKSNFENAIKAFPWINDSELKGWNSSFVEAYNIHATPTYFILDENNKIIAKPDHVGDVFTYLSKSK